TLKPGSSSDGHGSAALTADSVSATGTARVATLAVTVPTSSGGGDGSGGCTAALGPPAPWLALLGLVALARRRRR
ncbi:MAG TPA: hypothetical protein VFD38_11425, partial [Myxococcaceae bacterium]|nr:hypothetical protein [Myxococcaceae bacterium]